MQCGTTPELVAPEETAFSHQLQWRQAPSSRTANHWFSDFIYHVVSAVVKGTQPVEKKNAALSLVMIGAKIEGPLLDMEALKTYRRTMLLLESVVKVWTYAPLYAMRPKADAEFERLLQQRVVSLVQFNEQHNWQPQLSLSLRRMVPWNFGGFYN